ncbi:hypothetical protein SETIT_9G170200v2 [Setaria italica]|uniref:Transmembrane protein n=1 Tax=Setaria italica TaxID=4555 RepID=A0A368SHQ3_SETIT|nr:hypothetical protein SETIT_9G170200v2 [Setaria italica]
MAAVASNRLAVSATLLLALIVTGGCLAMASAVPVANGRRLQQLGTSGGLTSKQQALTSGLRKLSDQLQSLFQTVPLPSDLQAQLQQVLTSFDLVRSELQALRKVLVDMNSALVSAPAPLKDMTQGQVKQLTTNLGAILTQFRNPQPVGGCFGGLQSNLKAAIRAVTSLLMSTTPALIAALMNLENAVGLVNPCVPGLEKLLSNGQDVLATVGEIVAALPS